jgi:hypothetical protein
MILSGGSGKDSCIAANDYAHKIRMPAERLGQGCRDPAERLLEPVRVRRTPRPGPLARGSLRYSLGLQAT